MCVLLVYAHTVSGRKAKDILKSSGLTVIEKCIKRTKICYQIARNPRLIELLRHVRKEKECLDLGGEGEERVGPVVVERPNTHVVARAEEALFGSIPESEGEVAEKMVDAMLPPPLVGLKDQVTVGDRV